MRIRILKPGPFTTVQDRGRWSHLREAVPVSGPMDPLSARIANIALGNEETAAVLEFTYANAQFIAETDLLISFSGYGAQPECNHQALPVNRPVFIPAGNEVKLAGSLSGCRTYLAVAGGWNVPDVLGSKSTFITAALGGLEGRCLQKDDRLTGNQQLTVLTERMLLAIRSGEVNYPAWSISPPFPPPGTETVIRVVKAQEFNFFETGSAAGFFSSRYTLSGKSNRMGYHLEGPAIHRVNDDELLSTAVTPGTIQVTGNGSPLLLMADCQTTGGYPRIAQVAAVDLPQCGQLKPGDAIYFKEIKRQLAETLYLEREQEIIQLQRAVSFKFP